MAERCTFSNVVKIKIIGGQSSVVQIKKVK